MSDDPAGQNTPRSGRRDRFVTAEGQQVSAAGEEAERLLQEGATPLSGGRIRVVDTQTGEEGTIDADEFAANADVQARFRIATADESEQMARQEQFAGRGLETAITSGLDTVLFGGVSDRMADAGVAGELTGLREFNEGAALAGDLAGGVALGALAGAPLAGLRGAGLAGRLAAGVLEGTAGAGAEAVGRINREMALGDSEMTAQEVLGQIGMSALLGGSLGGVAEGVLGGVGALGRGLMRGGNRGIGATRDAVGRLVQRATGREAAPGVADALLDRIARAGGQGLGESDQAFLRRGLSQTSEGRALREAIDAGDAVIDDAIRPLRQQIDDLQQVQAATEAFAKGSLKRQSVRRLINEDALEAAADSIPSMVGTVRRMAEDIAADTALAGGKRMARVLSAIADEAEGTLVEAAQRGGREGATDAFVALDRLKRRFGQEVATANRGKSAGLIGQQMEDAYEVLREGLERQDLWGQAAQMQTDMNATWSRLIANGKQFRRRFLTDSGEQDGFRRLMTADPSKLRGYLGRTGTSVGELEDQIMRRQAELSDEFATVMRRHVDMDAADAANLERSGALARQLKEQLEGVRSKVGAQNQFKEVSEALGEREAMFGQVLSPGNLAIAGGAIGLGSDSGGGGAVAGLGIGAALAALKRPDRLMRMMAAMERMRGTFRQRLESSTTELVEQAAKATTREQATTRSLAGSIGALSAVAVAERFNEGVETLEKTQNLEGFAEELATRTQTVAEVAPDSAAHMVATAVRAAQYLQSILPPTAYAPPGTLGAPETQPSDRVPLYQQRRFLQAAQVVDDPLSVLDEASRGTLERTHVETLEAVYPRLHQQMVQRVVETVADRDEPLPYRGRLSVGLLVGTPTDPSLTGAYIARAQRGHAADGDPGTPTGPAVTPGNASPPEVSHMMSSEVQSLAQRRPSP